MHKIALTHVRNLIRNGCRGVILAGRFGGHFEGRYVLLKKYRAGL